MTSVAKQIVSTTTYNGWSNRETWVMNLWLTNDELHYDTMQYVIKTYDEYEQAEQLESLVRDELESTVSPSLVVKSVRTMAPGRALPLVERSSCTPVDC